MYLKHFERIIISWKTRRTFIWHLGCFLADRTDESRETNWWWLNIILYTTSKKLLYFKRTKAKHYCQLYHLDTTEARKALGFVIYLMEWLHTDATSCQIISAFLLNRRRHQNDLLAKYLFLLTCCFAPKKNIVSFFISHKQSQNNIMLSFSGN